MMLKKSAITGRLDLNLSKLVVPGIVMLAFIALGSTPWLSSGQIMALFFMQFMPNLLTVCAKDALKLSFGFDLGGKDYLRERIEAPERKVRNEKVTV